MAMAKAGKEGKDIFQAVTTGTIDPTGPPRYGACLHGRDSPARGPCRVPCGLFS